MSSSEKHPQVAAPPANSSNDVSSVDAIVRALYESVSFAPGAQPDYKRLRSLFHPEGRLIPPKGERDGKVPVLAMDAFIKKSREYVIMTGMEARGFFEKEVHRATESFGNIVHLFSTYESRHTSKESAPVQRGINSIQLVKDAGRWWVLTILWDIERPEEKIPQKYLA